MAKKKRQRISYVLPLANKPGGHKLGVNGLAFDQDRSILYTGGRDGVICAWDIDLAAHKNVPENEDLQEKKSTTHFRKQVQAHTHWVNDIVLVKNNLGLVSVSSDVTVKLWRPHGHETNTAYTIGAHSDYIKCVATPDKHSNWVASGGLDHRICLWDLSGGGKTLEINVNKADNVVKGSIYTLHARGSVLASGGPEGVVRLWDVKSGKGITKFVGHTDNIRDILMSDDGDTLLTASSDQTIKVWSTTAGRCLHTLTAHNDSVWCMYSDDPNLAVFYSGDKSGLVAKTDTRRAMEIEEGVSVAVCQEHDGIARVITAGNSIWTATSSSSVNRWQDVDTELPIETPPASPIREHSPTDTSYGLASRQETTNSIPTTNGVDSTPKIPHTAVLRLANIGLTPGRKNLGRFPNQSSSNLRKVSEVVMTDDLSIIVPVRGRPAETIEGQNGLIKHVMLNDKKRILTLDTAGEVVLWDLLKPCTQIKSFGRRHLDEVIPLVNKTESVANWCAVDTKTGSITVMLEENYCFDAEVYADEVDIAERLDFREDQRINLGKWVLRNLFTNLVDEEIRRDEIYRRTFRSSGNPTGGLQRLNAPKSIVLPQSTVGTPMLSPRSSITPRPLKGLAIPPTPGLAIGVATPGFANPLDAGGLLTSTLSPTAEEDTTTDKTGTRMSQPSSATEPNHDYFSSGANNHSETSSESNNKQPATPGEHYPTSIPTSPTEEKKKSLLFGKNFKMAMAFPKKHARTSTEVKSPIISEEKSDSASNKSLSEKEDKVVEDNFFGSIQKIRQDYEDHMETKADQPLPIGITPSSPLETPVLKPPPHTVVIIQEDNPESGGLADQYRGTISQLGNEADILEKIAPMWLGELLLKNHIPFKDTVKVSFILLPYENILPPIASPDGNARLNANRMLRAKKILAYVAERIEAPPHPLDYPPTPGQPNPMKPEEYLELYCQGHKVDPNTTLSTLRVHVWKTGGDVVLYYKANGRKEIKTPHPAEVPTEVESRDATGVVR